MSNADRCRRYRDNRQFRDMVRDMLRDMLPQIIQGVAEIVRHGSDMAPDTQRKPSPITLPKENISPLLPVGSISPSPDGKNGRKAKSVLADWRPSERHYSLAEAADLDRSWLDDQAERYRDWLANAKQRHTNFDAGFNNWLKRAIDEQRVYRKQINGYHHKPSARDNLFLGAALAAESWEARQRNRGEADEPFLDGQ